MENLTPKEKLSQIANAIAVEIGEVEERSACLHNTVQATENQACDVAENISYGMNQSLREFDASLFETARDDACSIESEMMDAAENIKEHGENIVDGLSDAHAKILELMDEDFGDVEIKDSTINLIPKESKNALVGLFALMGYKTTVSEGAINGFINLEIVIPYPSPVTVHILDTNNLGNFLAGKFRNRLIF